MIDARIRLANDRPVNPKGRYVLYWMQMFRRLHANHALEYALSLCKEWKKPLVVFEGLKLNYPWASARHHTFILQGMRDNAAAARKLGVSYWPFVETPDNAGRGLVRTLSADACAIVTDDYPAFIVPAHNRAIAAKCDVPVILVDSNSLVPLSLLGAPVPSAAVLRHRIHKHFADAWQQRAAIKPDVPKSAKGKLDPPFELWDSKQNIAKYVAALPLDQSVCAVPGVEGGSVAGSKALDAFITRKLCNYAERRNQPDDPANNAESGLSAYLHYGHISVQEVVEAVLGTDWTPSEINKKAKGKREDFYSRDANANSSLDEVITWRDVGYQWHYSRLLANPDRKVGGVSWQSTEEVVPRFNFDSFDFSNSSKGTLDLVLPEWARATLHKHEADTRQYLYRLDEFEAAETHDSLWNAAQRELVATGRIHNYLRMLWGKKVMEWSKSPAEAYTILEHLNNKYAVDGRDPNSYTGILWCFGMFDRPWPPERKVFGSVRYMSSENTAKKFNLDGYYTYIDRIAPR